MSFLTVRGRDSAEAMDLVVKKLGPDAMILSTIAKDGFVEIVASSEATEQLAPVIEFRRWAKPKAEPKPAPEAAPQPEPQPEPSEKFADHLPSFMRARTTSVATVPVIRTTREQVLSARRVVLVGPLGAGKSHVALQLANERIDAMPDSVPNFAFIGSGSHSDGAYMTQKAWLLGEEVEFTTGEDRALPADDKAEIAVVSAGSKDMKSAAFSLAMADQSVAILVIPAGLRTELVEALATQWRGIAKGVMLTSGPGMPVVEADLEAVKKTGLPLLWTARRDRLIGGLGTGPTYPSITDFQSRLEATGELI